MFNHPGRNVAIHFTELFLREGLDKIYVGSGDDVNETAVVLNITRNDQVSMTFLSPSDSMWVWFTSGSKDASVTDIRFQIRVKGMNVYDTLFSSFFLSNFCILFIYCPFIC